jgi:DNA-binding transcriptional LysR family regulator
MISNPFDTAALRYLLEVVEAGSFAKAALRLGVNPSTLTRRVSAVEDRLGLTVLERTRSGVRVTSSGRGVILQVKRALGEFATLEDVARSNGIGHSGELRIGFRMPPIGGVVFELLTEWRKIHPGIRLKFYEMNDHEIRAGLVERRISAAFVVRHAVWPGAPTIPVCREAITVALPSEHILAAHDSLTWGVIQSETLLTQGWNDSQTAREFFASLLGSGVIEGTVNLTRL